MSDPEWRAWREFRGTVFLTGHGEMKMDLYAELPKGTRLTLPFGIARPIEQTDADALLSATTATLQRTEPRVFEWPNACQNLTLLPDPAVCIERSARALERNPDRQSCRILNINAFGKAELTLRELFASLPGNHYIWACCQSLRKSAAAPPEPARATISELENKLRERRTKIQQHFVATLPSYQEAHALQVDPGLRKTIVKAVMLFEAFGPRVNGMVGVTAEEYSTVSQKMGYDESGLDRTGRARDRLDRDMMIAKQLDVDPLYRLLGSLLDLDREALRRAGEIESLKVYGGLATVKDRLLQQVVAVMSVELLQLGRKLAVKKDPTAVALIDKALAAAAARERARLPPSRRT